MPENAISGCGRRILEDPERIEITMIRVACKLTKTRLTKQDVHDRKKRLEEKDDKPDLNITSILALGALLERSEEIEWGVEPGEADDHELVRWLQGYCCECSDELPEDPVPSFIGVYCSRKCYEEGKKAFLEGLKDLAKPPLLPPSEPEEK